MTRDEFHLRRRMFVVDEGNVMIAEAGDPRTHWEWLTQWFGREPVHAHWTTTTRGYVLDGQAVFYRGNFLPDVDPADVELAVRRLEAELGPITRLGFGAVRSTTQQPWPVMYETSLVSKDTV
jgi:hypothetical protein